VNRREVLTGLLGLPFVVHDAGVFQATPDASPVAVPIYPVLRDPRDLFARPWTLENQLFSISGTITHMIIAPPEMAYHLEEQTGMDVWFRCVFTLKVMLPDDRSDHIAVGFDNDPAGAYEGDRVTVKGELVGYYEARNQRGVVTVWPFVRADRVVVAD
jgi:hypothetical protein